MVGGKQFYLKHLCIVLFLVSSLDVHEEINTHFTNK